MSAAPALIGQRFGRLIVTEFARLSKDRRPIWKCLCDCGATKEALGKALKSGGIKSCGCLQRDSRYERSEVRAGQRFGRLITVQKADAGPAPWFKVRWECRCDCGAITVAKNDGLLSGHTKSCGCLQRENLKRIAGRKVHGDSVDSAVAPEYRSWQAMITRCENPKSIGYHNYGGRGIRVCEEWRKSYVAFLAYIGRRPSLKHSIDRYPDVNGNYEPGNVRWATKEEQGNNMRKNRVLTLDGVSQTLTQWAKQLGVDQASVRNRLNKGWTLRDALTLPRTPANQHTHVSGSHHA